MRLKYILVVLAVVLSNLGVYYLVSSTYEKKICDIQAAYTEDMNKSDRIEEICKELEAETIESTDEQNAYDQVTTRPNKSFVYDKNGNVYIQNEEVCKYNLEDALAINKYYQDIIDKFIKLYEIYESKISVDDIKRVGFMPEVTTYGFKNIYPDVRQNYMALAIYYIAQRKTLELELEKFLQEKSTMKEVENCYNSYIKSKHMLNDYIKSVAPGDL